MPKSKSPKSKSDAANKPAPPTRRAKKAVTKEPGLKFLALGPELLASCTKNLYLPSAFEMGVLDKEAISGGVPALELMERAGAGIAQALADLGSQKTSPIAIVCGSGNNGGDGIVVARLLAQQGYHIDIVLVTASRYSPGCLKQLSSLCLDAPKKPRSGKGSTLSCFRLSDSDSSENSAESSSQSTESLPDEVLSLPTITEQQLEELLLGSSIVLDALLGTGHQGSPRGSVATAIECINTARSKSPSQLVVAVDAPSGLDASEGGVPSFAVQADRTIAIECLKRGMVQHPAIDYLGQIAVLPIGISAQAEEALKLIPFRLLVADASSHLPEPRSRNVHKGRYARVAVVGGSEAMPGAPILSAWAALRSGAPLVAMTSRRESPNVWCPPEIMHIPLSGDPSSSWVAPSLAWVTRQPAVVAVGPGVGTTREALAFFEELLESERVREGPLVIDADGLSLLAKLSQSGGALVLPKAVLTPHPGEMGRLLGISAGEVEACRYSAASRLAQHFRCTVVLKGASTIIATAAPESRLHGAVNLSGTPWLATGGSGDVLTGIIAALLAQGLSPYNAACGGVLIHARAGELAAQHASALRDAPIVSSDIVAAIPSAISAIRSENATGHPVVHSAVDHSSADHSPG